MVEQEFRHVTKKAHGNSLWDHKQGALTVISVQCF